MKKPREQMKKNGCQRKKPDDNERKTEESKEPGGVD